MQTSMPVLLPETLNFVRQVELNRKLEGQYQLAKLQRLAELLLDDSGYVNAKLEFGHSVGFACLKARVSATLQVKCERCLQPMNIDVNGKFKFALLHDEDEFELLPDEFEPYLLKGEVQSVIDLVEDELLLSLPMVITHDEACSDFMSKQADQIKTARESAHPFAALKALKGEIENNTN
jgi:uncharacterized protein